MGKDVATMGPTVYSTPHRAHRGQRAVEMKVWTQALNTRVKHGATCLKQVAMESHFFSKSFPQRTGYHEIPLATRLQAENLSKLDSYTLEGIQTPY